MANGIGIDTHAGQQARVNTGLQAGAHAQTELVADLCAEGHLVDVQATGGDEYQEVENQEREDYDADCDHFRDDDVRPVDPGAPEEASTCDGRTGGSGAGAPVYEIRVIKSGDFMFCKPPVNPFASLKGCGTERFVMSTLLGGLRVRFKIYRAIAEYLEEKYAGHLNSPREFLETQRETRRAFMEDRGFRDNEMTYALQAARLAWDEGSIPLSRVFAGG